MTHAKLPGLGLLGLAASLVVALAGCAQRQATFLPTGQQVTHITCNLAPEGSIACYHSAGALCGAHGYVLYDWNGKPWRLPYPSPTTLDNDPDFGKTGLLAACKP